MTYNCTAIFAKGDQTMLDAARHKWRGCLARFIDKPFLGIGIADPGADRCYPLVFNSAENQENQEIARSMKEDLLIWSENFPHTIFVYLQAECFGGLCEFEGFAVHNGIELCRHSGKHALKKLAAYLDVELDDQEIFEPFGRGFFHICRA